MNKYLLEFIGEFIGTFIIVFFGCGSVISATLFESFDGLFQVAFVWIIGVTLAIYSAKRYSNAHLNPAVSIAMLIAGKMKTKATTSSFIRSVSRSFRLGRSLVLDLRRIYYRIRNNTPHSQRRCKLCYNSIYVWRIFPQPWV